MIRTTAARKFNLRRISVLVVYFSIKVVSIYYKSLNHGRYLLMISFKFDTDSVISNLHYLELFFVYLESSR